MQIKVIDFESDKYGEGQIFLKWNSILAVVDRNDANWRHEYFNPIFDKVGIDVVPCNDMEPDAIDYILGTWFGY